MTKLFLQKVVKVFEKDIIHISLQKSLRQKNQQRDSLQYVFMFILILLFYDILSVLVLWCKRTFYLFPYIGAAQKGMWSVYCFFISPAVIRKSNWASLPSMELS